MKATLIKDNIYWVGAKDWNVRDFHGYKTGRGTSYNSYLIIDEKITLIDTVKETHIDEMMERISSIIDPSKIDIVISNHVEMDHSGGLPLFFKKFPKVKLYTSTQGEKGLKEHYDTSSWNINVLKHEEELSIGKRTLKAFHTPMVHWPDSMAIYIENDKLLLPNDSFGQHIATEVLFDDELTLGVTLQEAAKYYANIVYPYGKPVLKLIKDIQNLEIDMVAPAHGVIWRSHVKEIFNSYDFWANDKQKNKALIVFDSMWKSTEMMAHRIKYSFEENDIPVMMRSLKHSHISDVMTDILDAKYVILGSPVLNNMVLPTMGGFLTYMKGLAPKEKIGFTFGSYGWNGKAIDNMNQILIDMKWKIPISPIKVKYVPSDEDMKNLTENINLICKE